MPQAAFALLVAATIAASGCWRPEAQITVDPSTRAQTIEGWGTSMINWNLAETPYGDPAWRRAYRDLGLNILRIDVDKQALVDASGDLSVPVPLGADLESNVATLDFTNSKTRVFGEMAAWLKDHALEPERVKVTGSVWSPPHWMKGPTGSRKHHVKNRSLSKPTPWLSERTSGASIGGRLLQTRENLEQLGRYLAAWVEGFERVYGVPIYALSLQNELSFENPFDSTTYEKGPRGERGQWWQYASALKAVKDVFKQERISTKLIGPHVAHVGKTPENPSGLVHQMSYIAAVKAHPDRELLGFLYAYNSNGYLGTSEDAVKMWAAYYRGKDLVPARWAPSTEAPGIERDGKPVWISEAGGAVASWLEAGGDAVGDGAITVAQKMHNALVHGHASAYVYWQLSDDEEGETPHTLLGTKHVARPHRSKKYAAFKHFSRYIRPGAVRIGATFANGKSSIGGRSEYDTYNGLNVSAYLHEADRTITVVLVNMRASEQKIAIRMPTSLSMQRLRVYLTNDEASFERQNDLPVRQAKISLTAPAHAVLTLHGEIGITAPLSAHPRSRRHRPLDPAVSGTGPEARRR